jgi:O-antigen ligase
MLTGQKRLILSEFSAAVFVFSMIIFSYREGLTYITQACGLLFITAFVYEAMFKADRFKFIVPLPMVCFFGFMLYSFVSLIWTNQSVSFVATLLQLFVVSLIMINMIVYQGNVRSITYGFVAGLLAATYDLWKQLGGFAIQNEWDRLSSYAGNANVYAIALFIGIILCMESMMLKTETSRHRTAAAVSKLTYLLLVLLFTYEIFFLSGSRKGMIAVFLFGFMYFLKVLFKVKFLQKIAMVAVGAAAMTGLFFVMQKSVFFERLNRAYEMLLGNNVVEGSLNERSHMISDGLLLWQQKPIFGWGTDQFRYLSGYQTYSHNNFVELLGNNGLVGLVLYYSMILILLFAGLRLLVSGNDNQKHYGWLNLTVLFILIFWDFALVSYYSKLQWVILSVIIGLTYYAHANHVGERGAAVVA